MDDPTTLRTYTAIFEKMLPIEATLSAAKALRFQADEIERRRELNSKVDTAGRVLTCKPFVAF